MEEQQQSGWEYFEKDGAYFRRPAGRGYGGVTDVLHGSQWKPYTGDRTAAYLYGDRVEPEDVPGGFGLPRRS